MNNPSNYYSCNSSNGGAVMTTALGNANQQSLNLNSNDHFQLQQQHQQLQPQQMQQLQQQQQRQQQHHHMQQLQHQQHLHLQHQQQHQHSMLQPQQQLMPPHRYPYQCGEMQQTFDSNVYGRQSTPAPPYHHQQHNRLVSLDGIQSGVPTLTTSTLTPTTLRNIEQTFIELTADPPSIAPYQAGFVPPPAPFNFSEFNNETNSMPSSEDSQGSWQAPMINEDNSLATTDTSSVATTINANDSPSFQSGSGGGGSNNATTSTATNDFKSAIAAARASAGGNNANSSTSGTTTHTPSRRNQGGRRPAKATNMSPEEEEKRRVRRERNKLAAARCRKRRVDQTNELLEEVAGHEKRRDSLQKEIAQLYEAKDELAAIFEAHIPHCRKIRPTNNNLLVDTFNVCDPGRGSPLDLKPVNLPDFDVKSIKSEPNDNLDSLDGPPSPKRVMLSQTSSAMVPPLPNVSTISASIHSALNTPTITNSLPLMLKPGGPAKQRPSSLNVPLQMITGQTMGMGKTVTDINGVAITTPSSGVMFNFDSLMDGGTGLTPVSGPLIPTQNKHPLELTTPTSEPSKLVSL